MNTKQLIALAITMLISVPAFSNPGKKKSMPLWAKASIGTTIAATAYLVTKAYNGNLTIESCNADLDSVKESLKNAYEACTLENIKNYTSNITLDGIKDSATQAFENAKNYVSSIWNNTDGPRFVSNDGKWLFSYPPVNG